MDPQTASSNAAETTTQVGDAPAPPETQGTETTDATPVRSIREAFEVAQAASTPATEEGQAAKPASPDGTSAATPPADAPKPAPEARKPVDRPAPNIQAALRRYETLRSQNRLSELTPEESGEIRRHNDAVVREHQAQQDRETQFKGLYLELCQLETEDPAKYAADIKAEPQKLAFQLAYAKAHPDVTLETPTPAEKPLTREQHYDARDREWYSAVDETVVAIAEQAGLKPDELAGIRQGAKGPLSYMTDVFNEAVKRESEKARASIRRDERQAASQETSVRTVGKVVTPVMVPGKALAGTKPTEGPPKSIREAFERASQLAE